jgi:hypothetical protein
LAVVAFAAYDVLDLAKVALGMLESEDDIDKRRVLWVGAMALLRSVGHVFGKVDCENFPEMNGLWVGWKEEKIFKSFIEKERNDLLKKGESSVSRTAGRLVMSPDGESWYIPHTLYWPIEDGDFAGESCLDVYKDAITWWEGKLGRAERELSR